MKKEGTQDIFTWKRCHRSIKMADTSKGARFYIISMVLVLSQQTYLILHVLATFYGMMGCGWGMSFILLASSYLFLRSHVGVAQRSKPFPLART